MEDFKKRLQTEQKELNEKIGKLTDHLCYDGRTGTSETQYALLELQLGHMKHYASCLNLRLADLLE